MCAGCVEALVELRRKKLRMAPRAAVDEWNDAMGADEKGRSCRSGDGGTAHDRETREERARKAAAIIVVAHRAGRTSTVTPRAATAAVHRAIECEFHMASRGVKAEGAANKQRNTRSESA